MAQRLPRNDRPGAGRTEAGPGLPDTDFVCGVFLETLYVIPTGLAKRFLGRAALKTAATWRDVRRILHPQDYEILCNHFSFLAAEDSPEFDERGAPANPFHGRSGRVRKTPRSDAAFDFGGLLSTDFYVDVLIPDPGEWMLWVLPDEVMKLGKVVFAGGPSDRTRLVIDPASESAVRATLSALGLTITRDDALVAAMIDG